MISWVVATVVGVVAGEVAARMLVPGVLASGPFQRRNYRNAPIATAGGLVLVIVTLALAGVASILHAVDDGLLPDVPTWSRTAIVVVAVGFGFLGLLDDLVGDRSSRGFSGHLAALVRRRPTTGTLKLLGGGAVSLVAVAAHPDVVSSPGRLLVAGAVVALSANVANLFDLAPARCTKVASLAMLILIVVAVAGDRSGAEGAALVVIGAAVALARHELAETVMLGDTGANLIGATIGVVIVGGFGVAGQLVALAVLVVVNAAAELVSFSTVIEATPPLRWIDGLGRRR